MMATVPLGLRGRGVVGGMGTIKIREDNLHRRGPLSAGSAG